jgi:Bacteriophage T4 gp5 C-terminal trimerisation domain
MPDVVYRGDTQTCTGTPVPPAGADNHIPTNGSAANWRSITSESFLAGPKPGQEQVLIKAGNQTAKVAEGQRLEEIQKRNWLHVYDTATENGDFEFDKHRNTTVSKNDTLTVLENQKLTVKLDQTVRVEENQSVTVNKKRNITAKEITEIGDRKIIIQTNGEIIIQGPGGSITINSKGVTIQGVLVKIN